jgi:hypothetical protein
MTEKDTVYVWIIVILSNYLTSVMNKYCYTNKDVFRGCSELLSEV